ncbi:MAG: hypothetical protein K5756_07620 [Clostridiales bacterium]|nr:hypothetical protein [Clostridiales bacterium]
MTKFISLLLAAIIAFLNLIPGITGIGQPKETMVVGEWLKTVNSEFGMTEAEETVTPYYADITADDPYFMDVQIAYEWGVINSTDKFATSDKISMVFVGTTLVRVANLTLKEDKVIKNANKLENADEIAIAVSNGILSLQANGKFKDGIAPKADALAALDAAKAIWASKTFDETTFDIVAAEPAVGTQGLIDDEEEIGTGDAALNLADVVEAVELQTTFSPDLRASEIKDAEGNVLNNADAATPEGDLAEVEVQENFSISDLKDFDINNIDYVSLLKKVKLNFKIGDFRVKASVNDNNGFDVSIGGDVCDGVNITKAYSLSNLQITTNLSADVIRNDIKNSYLRIDYDLEDTTILSGSYAASLAEKELPEDAGDLSFFDKLKDGLLELKKGTGNSITIFEIEVPIPNVPCITICLELQLQISVDGVIKLAVVSKESKGYEFVNGKARAINVSEELSKTYDIQASAEVLVGLGLSIKVVGVVIVDATVYGGIGVFLRTTVTIADENGQPLEKKTIDLPFDLAVETTIGANNDKIDVSASGDLYGIVKIAIGEKSVIMRKIKLNKTWTICDRSNATFAHFETVDGEIVFTAA